ncbi:MAG TPA: hypothetical protein PLC89_20695, partial [Haliscomenobacter sp.]|uniref:hypothetical protein n=1 Tax=Haliscomenobacter sp. TaxID=2717303 RepID=UPI002B734A93
TPIFHLEPFWAEIVSPSNKHKLVSAIWFRIVSDFAKVCIHNGPLSHANTKWIFLTNVKKAMARQ